MHEAPAVLRCPSRAIVLPDGAGAHSVRGDATSPVVVHYRVLGVTTSQTVSLGARVLVLLPYRACR
ncbi:MAG TPA: hypothetical protein VFV73_13210 [Streptosporangiaceae bacterium]|nr:hypothetical protein [Streptosporangiaceae bacterium]